MASWSPFTLTDIGLSQNERALFDKHLSAGRGQAILDSVLSRIRTAAAAGGPVDAREGTLPPELRNEATAIARHLILLEIPAQINANDGNSDKREKACDNALATIKDLAAGKVPISRPAATEGAAKNSFSPRWSGRQPWFGRDNQAGT